MRNRIMSDSFTFLYIRSERGKKAFEEFRKMCQERYPIREYCLNKEEIKKLFYHYLYLRFKYGANMTDYFLYEFYRSSDFDVRRYMTERQRVEIYRQADDKDYLAICSDKKLFYNTFSEYMQKDCLFLEDDSDKERFYDFLSGKTEIIVKPRDGQRGIGVKKIKLQESRTFEDIWKNCLDNRLVIEKVIKGCRELEDFHPLSLNTIRVSTAIDSEGSPHIMAATIRTGVGNNCVDNGHSQGIYAAIDTKSGIISTIGYNANGDRFPTHPDSGKAFAGTEIPKWKELRILVKEVASKIPQLRYVGWDWALDEHYQWILIEGNEPGGIDVHQHPGFVGLYNEYHKILCE